MVVVEAAGNSSVLRIADICSDFEAIVNVASRLEEFGVRTSQYSRSVTTIPKVMTCRHVKRL
jgi:hypothetical protein